MFRPHSLKRGNDWTRFGTFLGLLNRHPVVSTFHFSQLPVRCGVTIVFCQYLMKQFVACWLIAPQFGFQRGSNQRIELRVCPPISFA